MFTSTPPPIKTVAVALTGKTVNPNVIHEAVRLSRLLNAELKVVHVRWPRAGELTMMMEPLPLYTEKDLRAQFRRHGYADLATSIPVTICEGTNVARLLAEVTEGIDLLVLGHRYRNRIQKALMADPIQQQILDVISCPVLVVPKPKRARSGLREKESEVAVA